MSDEGLGAYCEETARAAYLASQELAGVAPGLKNDWLDRAIVLLGERREEILAANAVDVAAAPGFRLTAAAIDRLTLNPKRIEQMAEGLRQVRALPDPVGETIESSQRPNGLEVRKVRAPLGVVFFIYESRPNVTVDAAALCIKSGNGVILRGGKEAAHSSRLLADLLRDAAKDVGLPVEALQYVRTTDREAVGKFLALPQYISVAIPRGGEGLIRSVTSQAKMPVMKHFNGNCHVYVDAAADLDLAEKILVNSKCQRMGVCNAAESLLVHEAVAAAFLPRAAAALAAYGVEVRGDAEVRKLVPTAVPATEADHAAEFLGPIISAAVVPSLDAALEHIRKYSSGHTEAIVTKDLAAARRFTALVDSSAVIVNASTRFNDGFEFGLGAEIGISTDKYHARGPCGLKELTTYKYVVYGDGQIRE